MCRPLCGRGRLRRLLEGSWVSSSHDGVDCPPQVGKRAEAAGRPWRRHGLRANKNLGEVEESEHLGTDVLDEHVRDDGGSDGRVAGLADSNHGAAEEEGHEVLEERF